MCKLFKKGIRCPECNGPGEVVRETEEYLAIKCLRGHWQTYGTYNKTFHRKVYPVILVAKEVKR